MKLSIQPTAPGRPPQRCPITEEDVGNEALKAAITAYTEAGQAERAARQHRDAAHHDLERGAAVRDAEATAKALVDGSRDPGGKHVAKARAEAEDSDRRWQASVLVLDQCRVALNAALKEHLPAEEVAIRERLAQLVEVQRELLDGWLRNYELTANCARLLAIGASYDRSTARPSEWVPRVDIVAMPRIGDGDVCQTVQVIEKLQGLGVPPAAKPDRKPSRQQTNPRYGEGGQDPTDPFAGKVKKVPVGTGAVVIDGATVHLPQPDDGTED